MKPDPGWNWDGWSGVLDVEALPNPVKISSKNIIRENDMLAFTESFVTAGPKMYKAIAFPDTAGTIATATFFVDRHTLDDKLKISGGYAMLTSTTGKFICNFEVPSIKATPGGPLPDTILMKTGTWEVVNPNQKIVHKNPVNQNSCVESKVAEMSHNEKMVMAIHHSEIGEAFLEEIGGAKGIATIMAIGTVVALIPGGIVAEAVGAALLVAGAAISGFEIGKGIGHLSNFYHQTENAKTCQEIKEGGKTFASAAAEIGIGGIGAALSVIGGKKFSSKTGKLKPLGLGSTGRTVPANSIETAAMDRILADPTRGSMINGMKPLSDPKWSGWRKMYYEYPTEGGKKAQIHFNALLDDSGKIIKVDDFKFK